MSYFDDVIAASRGAAYSENQIVSHSYYNDPIDTGQDSVQGNSRRWGDASVATQEAAVKALISDGKSSGLTAHDIAYVVSIARVESGFRSIGY